MSELFGTDGIRGIPGQAPLNAPTLKALAAALAELLREGEPPHRVLIGRDTRRSGAWIERILASELEPRGIPVVSAGVVTTPAMAFLARQGGFGAAVVISASHNPALYNGVKIFSRQGFKLADELEDRLEARIAEWAPGFSAAVSPPRDFSRPDMRGDEELTKTYEAALEESVGDLGGLRLVVDCAHGANWLVAPRVLGRLGIRGVFLGVSPDGSNINENCGALHPESVCSEVKETGADAGICFDGDGDRVILCDERGRVVDGDQVLYLLARYSEVAAGSNLIVGTVMSNLGLEVALRDLGFSLLRAPVGDKFVNELMLREGARIGGEQSGHVILRKYANTGDGLLTALQVLAVLKREGRTLSALLQDFKRFPQLLVNIEVTRRSPLDRLAGFERMVEEARAALGPDSRIVIRYSGTEPLLRVMVEGKDNKAVTREAHRMAHQLLSWLS